MNYKTPNGRSFMSARTHRCEYCRSFVDCMPCHHNDRTNPFEHGCQAGQETTKVPIEFELLRADGRYHIAQEFREAMGIRGPGQSIHGRPGRPTKIWRPKP